MLVLSFFAVLFAMGSPIFRKQTALQYADNLFNELSKQSSYYIPDVARKAAKFNGEGFEVEIETGDESEAETIALISAAAGASAKVGKDCVLLKGDLGRTAAVALRDADVLFKAEDAGKRTRYGCDGQTAIRHWWFVFTALRKQCLRENKGAEANFLKSMLIRGLEPAYNFAGTKPTRISERFGMVIFLLAFYVGFTIWWGVGVMYVFEGLGLAATKLMEKREV